MRKYDAAAMDVVRFEGTAAEIVTGTPDPESSCPWLPCRGEDQTPIITSD
nr:hypothetical protein [[Eubacterium] cellulosolvens]